MRGASRGAIDVRCRHVMDDLADLFMIIQSPLSRHAQVARFARRALLTIGALVMACVLMAGGTYLFIQHGGNFHTVEPQVVYRSAQLSGQDLHQVVRAHGIKTVLSLRGQNTGEPWYDDEMRTVRAEGIEHLDVSLSAYRDVSVEQMNEIIKLIDQAPKPILIHCESGADRTGLVSALYRLSHGQPLAVAEQELSPRYGHFTVFVPRSSAMDRSLAAYARSRAHLPASASQ